jgi:hypothetical protein
MEPTRTAPAGEVKKEDQPIICLKEKVALKEVNKCLNMMVNFRRREKNQPLFTLTYHRFKDEVMAAAMTNALYASLLELLKEPVVLRDMRDASWKPGDRKLVLAVGVSPADVDKAMADW